MVNPIERLASECDQIESSTNLAERDAKQIMEIAKEIVKEMEQLREDNNEVAKIVQREGMYSGRGSEGENTYYAEEQGEETFNLSDEQVKRLREEVIEITEDTAEAEEIQSHIETLENKMEQKISDLKENLGRTHSRLEDIEDEEAEVKELIQRH